MKPTPTQRTLIEQIQNQTSFWLMSGDIDSTLHYSIIEQEVSRLKNNDRLSNDDADKFEKLIGDLFDFIKERK